MYLKRYAITVFVVAAQITDANAAPPVPFGTTTGPSSACPANFTCELNIADKDMMQRLMWSSTGQRFVQTIVDSTGTDKTHITSESFINASNIATQGISAKQTVVIPGADSLVNIATINTGWASTTGTPSIKLEQTQRSSYKGVGYASTFLFEGNLDKTGKSTGYYVDIRQEVTNSTAISTVAKANGSDTHVFVTRKVGGDRTTAGSATLAAGSQGMMGGGMAGGGGAGGSVSWKVGDEVQVIWIGQTCSGCQSSSGTMMGAGMGMALGSSSFSFQSYDNLRDGSAAVSTRTFSTTASNWASTFGAAPKMGSTISTTLPSAASTLKTVAADQSYTVNSLIGGVAVTPKQVVTRTLTDIANVSNTATRTVINDITTTNTVELTNTFKSEGTVTSANTLRINGIASATLPTKVVDTVTTTTSTFNTTGETNNPGSGTTGAAMGGGGMTGGGGSGGMSGGGTTTGTTTTGTTTTGTTTTGTTTTGTTTTGTTTTGTTTTRRM